MTSNEMNNATEPARSKLVKAVGGETGRDLVIADAALLLLVLSPTLYLLVVLANQVASQRYTV